MKILILQDDFPPKSFGGAGIIAYNLGKELAARGHKVRVVTAVQHSSETGIFEMEGMTVHRIEAYFSERFQSYWCLWNPRAVSGVKKVLEEFKPDVVHAHGVHGYLSYASLIAAKKSGARVVLTCHDVMAFNYSKLVEFIDPQDLSVRETYHYRVTARRLFRDYTYRYNPLRNILIRWILRNYVDAITAVSKELAKALSDNGIRNVKTIHNGIDTSQWRADTEKTHTFCTRYSLGDSVILFGGRISGVKGSDKMLEALSQMKNRIPQVQLLVIGQHDRMFGRMMSRAKELGVSDCIRAPGWLTAEELKAAYYASAVVAVPTLSFDSFPTMNLEAFACKKPVVATCFGGSRELVEDGVSGYIVNPYNVTMLQEKLAELLGNTAKGQQFGEAGFLRVARDFTLSGQAQAFEEIFRS